MRLTRWLLGQAVPDVVRLVMEDPGTWVLRGEASRRLSRQFV